MKNLIKTGSLIMAIIFCSVAQAQKKASDKSYAEVVNEVKQKQAMRNRMLYQMRQTTLPGAVSQNDIQQTQQSNSSAEIATQQTTSTIPEGKQQPASSATSNQMKTPRTRKQ
jgi:hypothetical protein